MGYTKNKIRGINFSFLLAGFVFACWALVCAWYRWPRGVRGGSVAGFGLLGVAALFFLAFPFIWARYPAKHPVNHELARYGKVPEMSARLDREMSQAVEAIGPFRFTASLLVYDTGLEFQMIPYDQIASAETISDEGTSGVAVRTRSGRSYHWFNSFGQGRFDPRKIKGKIREAARLMAEEPEVEQQS